MMIAIRPPKFWSSGCGVILLGVLPGCAGDVDSVGLLRWDSRPRGPTLSIGLELACVLLDGLPTCWGPAARVDPPSGDFVALGAGPYYACALDADGMLTCWGTSNDYFGIFRDAPPGPLSRFSAGSHACGVAPDGSAMCWGSSSSGPTDVPYRRFVELSAGSSVSCGLD